MNSMVHTKDCTGGGTREKGKVSSLAVTNQTHRLFPIVFGMKIKILTLVLETLLNLSIKKKLHGEMCVS